MKHLLQLLTAVLLALLCHSASADPFTPKPIPSNSVPIYVLQIDTGNGLEEFVAVALIGYCGGDPVNRVDPMGTDYVSVGEGNVVYWVVENVTKTSVIRRVPIGVRTGRNVRIHDGLGGGNLSLEALENKIGYRDFSVMSGTEYSTSKTGSLDSSALIKSSEPATYLGAMQDQLYLLGGITHRAAKQSADSIQSSVVAEQTLLENSPWLGAIRDQPWYVKYPHAYGYSLINTVSGTYLQQQDANTAAYDLGWKGIDDYVSDTRKNAFGAAASATATLAPAGKLQLKPTYSQAPVSGSEWFQKFGERYGAENVQWAQVPVHTGGKTSGVLVTEVGEVRLLSGYTGPTAAMNAGVVPGMNNILKAHVEAHAVSAMRQLNLNEATLYLNKIPCEWGSKNGCLNMLPRMLGEGRKLRVIVPGELDEVFTGVAK